MSIRHAPSMVSAILSLLCLPAAQTYADAASELDDAAARIQYAFYTADSRALEEGLALLGAMDAAAVPAGLTEYYAAYGHWKLAQIHAEAADKSAANKAAEACVRHARTARTRNARMAEAFAIESVCARHESSLLGSGCTEKPLRTAQELDARNPRIRLIDLVCQEKGEGDSSAYAQRLRDLAATFESTPARPGNPDWGYAEVLLMLGQSDLRRGDTRAARDAVERALVIAPDYRKAQTLLREAASRPK